jgi:hypothetical protein
MPIFAAVLSPPPSLSVSDPIAPLAWSSTPILKNNSNKFTYSPPCEFKALSFERIVSRISSVVRVSAGFGSIMSANFIVKYEP